MAGDAPNNKMTGMGNGGGSDTTFNLDVVQNGRGNLKQIIEETTQKVKEENEEFNKVNETIKKTEKTLKDLEKQGKTTMQTLLSYAKGIATNFAESITPDITILNNNLNTNISKGNAKIAIKNAKQIIDGGINELKSPSNILENIKNSKFQKAYEKFLSDAGIYMNEHPERYKTYKGQDLSYLLFPFETLEKLGFNKNSIELKNWVEVYKGSALVGGQKGKITDRQIAKAKKRYEEYAGDGVFNSLIGNHIETFFSVLEKLPIKQINKDFKNITKNIDKNISPNKAGRILNNKDISLSFGEEDIPLYKQIKELQNTLKLNKKRKKELATQIPQDENLLKQLETRFEAEKKITEENTKQEQKKKSINEQQIKQNEEKRKEAGLDTQANANLDTQNAKLKANTQEIKNQTNEIKTRNKEQQQANNTWGTLLATTASRFQNLGQEIGYNMSGFFITMRNMASTIYSVRNLGRMVQSGMSATENFNAQRYRFERYDTTGRSGNSLLMNAYAEAQRSRGDFESSTMLAQRILSTGVTNGNGMEAIRLAGLIDRASYLGGSTAQEARSAKLQLSQGLASNQLGGDELRSIRENAIGLTEMLAKGLTKAYSQGLLTDSDFANVGIGDLKELGKKAKLTAKTVTTAISVMEDEINEGFSKMPEQFSQTINKLTNSWNKIMYELNSEGKGLARITKLVQDFQKWLDTTEGKDTISALTEIVDKFIEMITFIAKKFAEVLNFAKPLIPILTDIAKWAIPLSLGSKLLFGSSRYNPITNTLTPRAGIIGIGGILPTLSRLLVPNKEIWNAGPLERFFSAPVLDANGKIKGEAQVGGAGLIGGIFKGITEGLAKQFGETSVIGKLATSVGKLLGPIGIIASLLGAAIVAFKYFDKKAENKYFDTEKSKFYDYSKLGLNDENMSTLDKMKEEWIKQYTNTFGYGAKATYTQDEWDKFNNKLYIESNRLLKEQIELEKQALEAQQQTAENTGETLELTDDFIRGIKDMRTRSFRGELAIANRGSNNEVNVVVNYTGDVADFGDKVLQAINEKVVPAMQNTIPVTV